MVQGAERQQAEDNGMKDCDNTARAERHMKRNPKDQRGMRGTHRTTQRMKC